MPCFFVCIECWGFHPKPGHKKLFEKSFLELQKLHQSEVVFLSEVIWNLKSFCQSEVVRSVGNSFAYFSYKKSRWHTFLSRKVWKFHFDFERFSALCGNYVVFIRNALSVYFYADNVASATVAFERYVIYASAENLLYGRFFPGKRQARADSESLYLRMKSEYIFHNGFKHPGA